MLPTYRRPQRQAPFAPRSSSGRPSRNPAGSTSGGRPLHGWVAAATMAGVMADAQGSTRIHRWLWAVRLTKTRTAAGVACKAGHVAINGKKVKAAAPLWVGDRVEARVGDRQRIVEVLALLETRVGAKVAVECYVDHSPAPEPFDPASLIEGIRDRGAGRPTKRDRRETERLKGRRGA